MQAHTRTAKGAKYVVKGSAFYIQASDKTALLGPVLEQEHLMEEVLTDIRSKSFTTDQWIQVFNLLQEQIETRKLAGGSLSGFVEDDALVDVKAVAARVERAADFETPSKMRAPGRQATMKVELTSFDEMPSEDSDQQGIEFLNMMGKNWSKLVGVVGVLEAALPAVQAQVQGLIEDWALVLVGIEDKANALGLALGQRGSMLDTEGTVWDVLARSLTMGAGAQENIRSLSEDLVAVDKRVNQVDTAFQGHVGEVLKVVGQIHGSHKRLQDRIQGLETVSAGGSSANRLSAAFADTIPGAVADELADLRVEIDDLRGVLVTAAVGRELGTSSTTPAGGDPSEFHERLQKVEMRATGESYISDQRVFASYEDVLNWVQGSTGRAEIHLYWDVFSLLTKTRDGTFSTTEYLEGALLSERLKQNPLTLLVMSSLQIQMPGPFLTGKSTGSGSSALVPLPTVKTFDDWNTVQTGFNPQLQRAVTTEVASLRRMMATMISKQDHELAGLATHMLTQAQIQWSSMATWITDFYHRLVGDGGVTAKESWLIVGTSVQSIFAFIHRTRAAGHNAIISSGDKSIKAAHLLWAAMQTHRLFTEIHLSNWDAHHCVQAVLSMHVVRHRITPTAFDSLSAKVDALSRTLDKLDGRLSTVEKKKSGN